MNIDQVDFSNVKTAGEVMDIFIKVARTCPTQSNKLFDRYAEFVQNSNPGFSDVDGRRAAASNIRTFGQIYYGKRTVNLLCKTYEGLRQH
ncbi:MAG: hypothetical protein J6T57_02695 [Alphaproteobacteria bacterium]|nr:hypothetical protein [Alphaproteobacteria bacterium]